jgi:uncharacterized protein
MSEAEIERLATRLAANTNSGRLSLEGVDGLFCALVAGPTMVMPSRYFPVILGGDPEDSSAFADLGDANETMSLLMRYWNVIAADFSKESIHMAYIEEPGTDGILGRDWARGYMQGTRLAPSGWKRIFTDEKEGLSITIPLVAGEMDPKWPKEPLTEEKSTEMLQMMLAGAGRAYRYFKADRRAGGVSGGEDSEIGEYQYREPYVRAEPKVGRNEACPCGSGRKYKRCCGSA